MKRLLILIFVFFFVSGCSYFQSKEEKTAPELASDGMDAFSRGNYKKSIELFDKLKSWYPFSKYAILAELKKADAHYELEEYEEAVFTYEEFEALHPQNEAVPYVIYQIGRCHFDQLETIDRDQTPAKKALETFERLIRKFPEDPYAQKARTHIKKCHESMAGHEFYIGLFYFKSQHYEAAKQRFMNILMLHPDVGVHRQAIDYVERCDAVMAKR
jgi:outer membrane protein assembly factor BamD